MRTLDVVRTAVRAPHRGRSATTGVWHKLPCERVPSPTILAPRLGLGRGRRHLFVALWLLPHLSGPWARGRRPSTRL